MTKGKREKSSGVCPNGVAMNQSSSRDNRYLRLLNPREVMAPRTEAMVSSTRQRISNTRRMITQSRTLLKRARLAIDSSRQLRAMDAAGEA